jgi:hypothetical protein
MNIHWPAVDDACEILAMVELCRDQLGEFIRVCDCAMFDGVDAVAETTQFVGD